MNIDSFGRTVDIPIRELAAERVLYEFDGPRIFSVVTAFGRLLAYVVRDESDFQLVLLSPTSEELLDDLSAGRVTVREAMKQSWSWLAELSYDGHVRRIVSVEGSAEQLLPRPGLMLYRHLQPLLSVKLEGDELARGRVKASVIKQALDAGTLSIKRVLDFLWSNSPSGRPDNAIRLLSDLPAQRFAYGSFEVVFGRPLTQELLPDAEASITANLSDVGHKLEEMFDWLNNPSPVGGSDDPDAALLKALERLVPPLTGPIKEVQISGELFPRRHTYTFTRSGTRKLRQALKLHEEDNALVKFAGRIGELDKDKLQFTLRDIREHAEDVVCRFNPELLEALLDYFNDDNRVAVFGRQFRNYVEIADIAAEAN